jgi:asparagine synthase (glutamine-hydrolysing)
VLKLSQSKRLPTALVHRRKAGFNAPVSHWLAGSLADLGRAATGPSVLGEWFEPQEIARLWDEHTARRTDHGLKLFGLTCLGLSLQEYA